MTELETRVKGLKDSARQVVSAEVMNTEIETLKASEAKSRGEMEAANSELAALQKCSMEEQNVLLQREELNRFHTVEDERRKWKARESIN